MCLWTWFCGHKNGENDDMPALIIIAALTFGLCFLVDRSFTGIFRNNAQHQTGLSVRLNKKYGAFGLILLVLGIGAVFTGLKEGLALVVGGGLVAVLGIGLMTYYMSFGIFYDEDSFLLTTFGKKSTAYHYRDIKAQQLYNSYGTILIELHMTDGRTVGLQSAMEGVYPFLDHAFSAWCRQKGIDSQNCTFHDPQNSCWFPSLEG